VDGRCEPFSRAHSGRFAVKETFTPKQPAQNTGIDFFDATPKKSTASDARGSTNEQQLR